MTTQEIAEGQIKVLIDRVRNKVVGKNLRKAAAGKTDPIRELITLNSLLTHALIEYQRNPTYMLAVVNLHEQVTTLLEEEIKREK
jgi:hypothetical protein